MECRCAGPDEHRASLRVPASTHGAARASSRAWLPPTPIMTPMNILEIAIRPTSLCMRLFGNVLGAFVIMELISWWSRFSFLPCSASTLTCSTASSRPTSLCS